MCQFSFYQLGYWGGLSVGVIFNIQRKSFPEVLPYDAFRSVVFLYFEKLSSDFSRFELVHSLERFKD